MVKKKILASIVLVICLVAVVAVVVAVADNSANNTQKTPYDQLCEKGYTGTEEDLLISLLNEEKNLSDNDQAKTAYDIATENNYKGTKKEWLETLTGVENKPNEYSKGTSVFDIVVQNGYSGNIEEWVESLKKPLDDNNSNYGNDSTSQNNFLSIIEKWFESLKKPVDNNENNNTTTNINENGTTEVPEKDTTASDAEATTEANEFTVIFKNYDGKVLKTEVVKKGEAATPPATPARKGYVFVGWDRTFNCVEFDIIVNAVFEKITKPTIFVDRVDSVDGEDKVAVNISLMNNPGISSLNLKVAYAPELVLKDVEYNRDLKGQSMKPGSKDSPVTLTWVSPFENVTGDWVFATLYFDVKEGATGDLPVSITYDVENIYNMKEENVYFDVVNGAVAITEKN